MTGLALRGVTLALVAASTLAACSATPPKVEQYLDEQTGVTVARANAPLILYDDKSGYAAHARDYVYVGPISVNRMGQYRYYLWMGIWSTITPTNTTRVRDAFETVILYADGEPLLLEIAGWTPDAIGVSDPVYLKPVASATDAYYAVTADQIRLLAEARDVLLRTTDDISRSYGLWNRQRTAQVAMQRFVESAVP